ncbi:RNA polymerase subunit sigma [Clostridium perfringens]|uniref:RNA polymerase subunit sigma n=1 Tax=Clostridium perfringens TaxID=1502 RepID=UPI000D70B88F|nr:RNA polymerase subunit sigma [Clostridium perfringens]ELC8344087.1 RNA polymerase subunit sigma [Clostridium perfringens]ELC8387934.1 RNA polymerase subunit sigma [Clostridium perfringens]ELC8460814.1 RNA polymerase subunit sigma [Clostridium perfringens]MBI6036620.1 RNA polymerase subunit sigma [Clostridium perfringens]MBI6048813.1 RNA polymerase subunit sigma [Clostridium perfringens]
MIRKMIIGTEELEFKMTNKTIFELDEMYGNFGLIINGIMEGTKIYNNSLKLLCASCITKDLSLEEVEEILTPSQVVQELIPFATSLYLDYMGIKETSDSEENESKKDNKKKA